MGKTPICQAKLNEAGSVAGATGEPQMYAGHLAGKIGDAPRYRKDNHRGWSADWGVANRIRAPPVPVWADDLCQA